MRSDKARLSAFLRDEGGFSTMLALFWSVILMIVGGLAVDSINAWRNRAILQATADAAAHAGTLLLPKSGLFITQAQIDAIKAEAQRVAALNMDPAKYGQVVTASSVEIGRWVEGTQSLMTGTNTTDAVRVTASRVQSKGNPVPTILLKMGILEHWDVGARSTVQKFIPKCVRSGIIANLTAELSSNNLVTPPFCLHGQQGVKMSNHNTFEPGTLVSMPDISMLQLPEDGLNSNPGLRDALREDFIQPRLVSRIDFLLQEMQNPRSVYQADYIKLGNGHVVRLADRDFNPANLTQGNIYVVQCGNSGDPIHATSSNKQLKLSGTARLEKVVVITNCSVFIESGALISDAVVLTANTSASAIGGSQGMAIGRQDNCEPGGSATLVAKGHVTIPQGAFYYDAQIVSAGNVSMAAAPLGIKGVAVQAGGYAKLTSNGGFALCPIHDEPLFMAEYFRVVE